MRAADPLKKCPIPMYFSNGGRDPQKSAGIVTTADGLFISQENKMSNITIETSLQEIINNLTNAINDAGKFDNGNASAGTRVRKAAMEATKNLKELRATVTEIKQSRTN